MEIIEHDIIIIGAGAAGLRAAIAAASHGDLSIALISKVYPMRSHTVAAEGGAAAALKDNDSLAEHAFDTIKGSDYLADQDTVEFFVEKARDELIQLEHWGCPWNREEDGRVSVRPFGGMSKDRTLFAADKTGFHLLHTLFQTSLKYQSITRYDEWFVTSIVEKDQNIHGVIAMDIHTGKLVAFQAQAVLICTGGAGRITNFTTNASIKTGDGMSLAYRAGVALKDIEFIQFHPTGLPGSGILITEAVRGEGGYLVNKDGERYLTRYLPEKMELGPRDMISRAFMHEEWAGRTFTGAKGSYVCLDLRHLGEELINANLPFVRELAVHYAGVDPVFELLPVRPVVHYMMGGIHTDINGRTSVSGLYAAGETACVSINGANRLGSNSLTECLVFGARAGEDAACSVKSSKKMSVDLLNETLQGDVKRIDEFRERNSGGVERVAVVRKDLQGIITEGLGIYRDEEGLKQACSKLKKLKARYGDITIEDTSAVYNTELLAAFELGSLLDVATAIAHSALMRQESRGAHTRLDFPLRDDENFLQHTLCYKNGDHDPVIKYLPVTSTQWQPETRTY